ncbi:carotenoid oxygenase family protein [Polaromonas sp. YR568]|uniref:carotenoid oxygenase family protein n=1 Tax=Polaromonas sp. YR568 TaxID=1855301 RepID=UPI00398BE504
MNAAVPFASAIESIAPFRRSPENPSAIPARIQGRIPDWLRGEVFRTCPAIFETGKWRAQHWFDGLGMIYAFRIGDSAVDFRSRLLDSETARDARRGKTNLAAFGTPNARPLVQRIFEPIPRVSDNTNVNIVRLGHQLVAMTEGNRQLVIDDETLASVEPVSYSGDALGGAIMSAHPHFDFGRSKVLNVATEFGLNGVISIYEHDSVARQRELIGSWRTRRVPYVHTFGLTPRSAILVAHPFGVSPAQMLWSSKGYIDHFDWRADEGTRLVIVDRSGGETREHVADAFFAFHCVNAFEHGDSTVLDVLAYPDADIVAALRIDRMLAELPDLRPSLLRIVMKPGVERASTEKLSDVGFEFPSTHYRLVNGLPYRFAYGASDGLDAGGVYTSSVVKVDVTSGSSMSHCDGTHIFGEPIFVARPQGSGEDDGVLLTVGSARNAESSVLAVLDARTMALLASAEVPSSIPLGFHGSFTRTEW